MSRRGPTARSVAAHVLLRVEKDQAFASASLDSELARAVQLTPADRRLATELVYGVLRCETFLDDRIERYTRKGVEKLDVEVRVHLRVAAYQILILDRIPAFAAVSAAVDLVRDARGHQVSRFANAVLRKIATEVQDHGRVSMNDAVKSSIHPGLLRRVTQALGGREQAEAMLSTGPFPPALGIRIHAGQDVDAWSRLLEQSGSNVRVQRGKVSRGACACSARAVPMTCPDSIRPGRCKRKDLKCLVPRSGLDKGNGCSILAPEEATKPCFLPKTLVLPAGSTLRICMNPSSTPS